MGTKVPENKSSRERKFHATEWAGNELTTGKRAKGENGPRNEWPGIKKGHRAN